VHAFGQAAKLNGRWGYSPFRRRPIGPFHPASKAALVCVTRGGLMKLLYQNPDNRWAEISAELKTTAYSDRILTHAAIAASPPTAPAMPGTLCFPRFSPDAVLVLILWSQVAAIIKSQVASSWPPTPLVRTSASTESLSHGVHRSGTRISSGSLLERMLFPCRHFVSFTTRSRSQAESSLPIRARMSVAKSSRRM
jgi:hypothetical protein